MDKYIIETKNLSKNFGNKQAISDFNIKLKPNRIIGLIGKNGSGKTTLMKILAGQLDITKGEVKVFSQNPMDNLNVLKRLVYIFHNYEYSNGLTLNAILSLYNEMIDTFDIDFANKLIRYFKLQNTLKYQQLSQGMASIFNFICGLSCRSELTMLDEPVLGMDVSVRKSVYEVLLRDYTEHPRTFIISSHLISEIEGVLSDIMLIDDGKLSLYDNLDNVREYAYRIDGSADNIQSFIQGKDIIYLKRNGLGNYAIIRGPLSDNIINESKKKDLELSLVRVEDLFIYLTSENREGELECLWQKEK